MTNERAIQLLHRLQDEQFDGEYGDERREALEMAVRALSSQQTVNDSQGLVNDCISRKQAIEAFEPTHYKDWYTPTIIETLETLPSVQLVKEPDGLVKDLVKDCISRQDAINSLDGFRCGTKAAWKVIEDLPSAQPERKKGRWILSDDRYWKTCSECGADVDVSMGLGIFLDNDEVSEMCFCPNCGADMRGEQG